MSMSVKFNGVELNEILDVIQGFTPFGGANMEPSFSTNEVDGSTFVSTRRNYKVIDMPFILVTDKRGTQKDKYDMLQSVLNVKEPGILEFGVFKNRFFYAIPNGDLSYEEEVFRGIGSIQWIIGDGLGHSKVRKVYDLVPNSDRLYEATLVNNGTDWATVDYEIENPDYENGYIGIASEHGIIQLGYPEEEDFVPASKSIVLTSNKAGNFDNWVKGTVNYQDSNKDCSGDMFSTTDMGGWLGPLKNLSNPNNKAYYGALREFHIDSPSTDWYIWARAWFETTRMGQTASWTLTMLDENNKVIAGMTIDKYDRSGNTARVTFFTGDGNGGTTVKKYISFQPTKWIKHNPYSNEGRLKNKNMFDLRKEGNKVTFYFWGKYYPFTVPTAVANSKAALTQFYLGQYRGRNSDGAQQRVTRLGLTDLTITQLNVKYQKDVPNRYPAGSSVYINGAERRSYFNGQLRLGDEVKGTRYFKIPPGETKIQANVSSWADPMPTIKSYVNEVYR